MEDRRRVVRPRRRDFPGKDAVNQERSQLLAIIHDSYEEAREHYRLPVKKLREAGFCIGLLDPVSNLTVNVVLVNSGAKAGKVADLERRSLDGMVVFLTTFFTCLADWEAVHYLLLANADLLCAACLILKDRAMETSPGHVDSMVKMALKCAALAAKHPAPDHLVGVWLSLSPRLDDAVADLYPASLRVLAAGGGEAVPTDMVKPWELAASRFDIADVPYYHHTRSLRRALLDKIHRYYLQALTRLPRRELRCRYHRGLLAAGNCYGPLNPASNVILNTIWYDATFPARRDQLEVDMINTNALGRAASRSLYGLVSFLCTRYGAGLCEHDAIRCLLDADADLHAATREAERRGHHPCGSTQEAWEAAATAAHHPDADAQATFLGGCDAAALSPLLHQDRDVLSSEDVLRLAELLLPVPPPQPAPPQRGTKLYWTLIRQQRRQFSIDQARIVRKVNAALDEYALRSNEPARELHVICGVNEYVSGPDYCPNGGQDRRNCNPCRYHRTHVNFLAASRSGGGAPVLFFAECSNDDDDQPPLCCLVGVPPARASLVRCLYCDEDGSKIVHPPASEFQGREEEFEAMACGEADGEHSNDEIISTSEYVGQRMCTLEEDSIYVDSDGASSDEDIKYIDTCCC